MLSLKEVLKEKKITAGINNSDYIKQQRGYSSLGGYINQANSAKKNKKSKRSSKDDFYFLKKGVEITLKDIFGEIGFLNIKVSRIESGILYLQIFKSIWSTEVKLNQSLLIKKINKLLNRRVVTEIKIFK